MYILESLARFYPVVLYRVLTVVVLWALFPGSVFAVGLVLESRRVPIGRYQSRAFFPGDLTIGVMLTAIIGMYAHTGTDLWGVRMPYWWMTVLLVMGVVAITIRSNDIKGYPEQRSRISPTKITHDVIGYFAVPTLLAGLGVPQLVTLSRPGAFAATRSCWLAFTLAVVGYLYCTALDFILFGKVDDNVSNTRHPADWQPIWVTKRLRK